VSLRRPPVAPLVYLLLAALGHLPALVDLTDATTCPCLDAPQTDWFLGWTPHALLSGASPLVSRHLALPHGVNLMWNTLLPLPGLLAAPVTLTLGVLAAHTLLSVAAFTGSATAAWWVVGRWAPWPPARFAAGLLYGFSPYEVAQGSGHLNLTLVALPPLVLLLLDDLLVRQDRSPVRRGALLGLVALAQLLTTEEVLASTFVMSVAGLVVLVVQHPGAVRRHAPHALTGLAVAAGVLVVLAAWPLAVQFLGPQRITAPVQDLRPYAGDLLGTVVPTVFQVLGTGATRHWGGNVGENGSYLGLPLLALLVVLGVRLRAVPVVRFAAALGVVAWVLSLGTPLHVAGHRTGVPLPGALLAHLPVLENMAAVRFSLYVVLAAALVLAVGLDRLHAAGALTPVPTTLAALACVLPLVPAWPYASVPSGSPAYFTSAAVDRVPRGSVALTYPLARYPASAPMLWQAQAGYRYRTLAGYVITPKPSGAGTFRGAVTTTERLLVDAGRGARVPRSGALDARVLLELSQLHVDSVLVVDRVQGSGEVRRYLGALLRRPPDEHRGGVTAWYGVQRSLAGRVRPR
jgi:hypothetical protein